MLLTILAIHQKLIAFIPTEKANLMKNVEEDLCPKKKVDSHWNLMKTFSLDARLHTETDIISSARICKFLLL